MAPTTQSAQPGASPSPRPGNVSGDPMAAFVCLPRLEPRESARAWCYRVLLHNIVHLRLPPGSFLPENAIRRCLKVSRTPVREAIMQLERENLIQILPQKGTYVTRIDHSQIDDLRFMRICVEVQAVRLATARRAEEEGATITPHLERQREAAERSDFESFAQADDEMHRALYRAAGRPGTWELFEKINSQHYLRTRLLALREDGIMFRLIREHAAIANAIETGDAEAAEAAVRIHLSEKTWNAESVKKWYPDYFSPA